MKRTLFPLIFSMLLCLVLLGCDLTEETGKKAVNKETNNEKIDVISETIPEGFPKDFPLPDDIMITNGVDKSEGNAKHYVIEFEFDPVLDFEAWLVTYRKYAEEMEYITQIRGRKLLVKGIFKYSAHKPHSTKDMFTVTLKLNQANYGIVEVKFTED